MTIPRILDSSYSWRRLAITLAISAVANVGMWISVSIMPFVQTDLGIDRASASMPYTIAMIGFALGSVFIGRAVDLFGVCRSVIGAAVCMSIGYVLATQSTSVLSLSMSHLIIGFGTAAGFGPLIADISHWFLRRRGIAVAIVACGNYLSGAIWPWLLTPVILQHGWQAAYWILAALILIVIVPLSLTLRRRIPFEATESANRLALENARTVQMSPRMFQWLLVVAGLGCCIAMAMPQVHIVSLCVDLGYGPAAGTEMLSLMLMGGVASRITFGLLADRLGGVMTLLIGSTLQCIALFFYLPFDGLASLYVVSLIFGLSQGGIVPSYAVIVREYLPAREAGARVGTVLMATIVGMAVGGWMSGWIYDLTGSYQMAFINGIVWNFLNIGVMMLIVLKSRSGAAQPA